MSKAGAKHPVGPAATAPASQYTPAFVTKAFLNDNNWNGFFLSVVPCDSLGLGTLEAAFTQSRIVTLPNTENGELGKVTESVKAAVGPAIIDASQTALRDLAISGLIPIAKAEAKAKFQTVVFSELVQWGVDNAKTFDICKEFKAALDAAGNNVNSVPPSLVALLLKLRLLLLRQESIELLAKTAASASGEAVGNKKTATVASARSGAAPTTFKKPDGVSLGGSAVLEQTPGDSVTTPAGSSENSAGAATTRRRTKLRDRGSNPNGDVFGSNNFQRFPESGFDTFVMLVDFVQPSLYKELEGINVFLNGLFLIDGCVVSRSQREELSLLKQAKHLDAKYDLSEHKPVSLAQLASTFPFLHELYDAIADESVPIQLRDTSILRICAHESKDSRELFDAITRTIYKATDMSEQLEELFEAGTGVNIPQADKKSHQVYSYLQQQLESIVPEMYADNCAANVAALLAVEQASRAFELEPAAALPPALTTAPSAVETLEKPNGESAIAPTEASNGSVSVAATSDSNEQLKQTPAPCAATPLQSDSSFVIEKYLNNLLAEFVTLTAGPNAGSENANSAMIDYESFADLSTVLASVLQANQKKLGSLNLSQRATLCFDHSYLADVITAYCSLSQSKEYAATLQKVGRDKNLIAGQIERECFSGTSNVQPESSSAILTCEIASVLANGGPVSDELLEFSSGYTWLEKLESPNQVVSVASQIVKGLSSVSECTKHYLSLATNQLLVAASSKPIFRKETTNNSEYFAKAKFGIRLFSELVQDFPSVLSKMFDTKSQDWYYTGINEIINLKETVTEYNLQGAKEALAYKLERGWNTKPVEFFHVDGPDDSFSLSSFFVGPVPLAVTSVPERQQTVGIALADGSIKAYTGKSSGCQVSVNTADGSVTFLHFSSWAHDGVTETKRVILADGTVLCFFKDGSCEARFPTGSDIKFPSENSESAQPVFTARDGVRSYVGAPSGSGPALENAVVTVQKEVDAKRILYVRSDLSTVSVCKKTGDCRVEWADGTVVEYTAASGNVHIEHPLLGAVSVCKERTKLERADGLALEFSKGQLQLVFEDSKWSVDAESKTLLYTPRNSTADIAVDLATCSAPSAEINEAPNSPAELLKEPPEFFLIQPDGKTSYRLLHRSSVDLLVKKIKDRPSAAKFVPQFVEERYNSLKTLLVAVPVSATKVYYRCFLQRPLVPTSTLKLVLSVLAGISEERTASISESAEATLNNKEFYTQFWDEVKQNLFQKSSKTWESLSGTFNGISLSSKTA